MCLCMGVSFTCNSAFFRGVANMVHRPSRQRRRPFFDKQPPCEKKKSQSSKNQVKKLHLRPVEHSSPDIVYRLPQHHRFDLLSYSTQQGVRPDPNTLVPDTLVPDTLVPDTSPFDLNSEYHRLNLRALKNSGQGSALTDLLQA
jgi:hypothetical protein